MVPEGQRLTDAEPRRGGPGLLRAGPEVGPTGNEALMSDAPALSMPSAASWLDFRPLPLLSNPHVQTLLGHFLAGPPVHHPTRRQVIGLSDGDRLVLHDTTPTRW